MDMNLLSTEIKNTLEYIKDIEDCIIYFIIFWDNMYYMFSWTELCISSTFLKHMLLLNRNEFIHAEIVSVWTCIVEKGPRCYSYVRA